MFVAFTTLKRDHNRDGLWNQEQKQETLRLTAEACRGSRIQAVSLDLYGLCICKDPNRTKAFAGVLGISWLSKWFGRLWTFGEMIHLKVQGQSDSDERQTLSAARCKREDKLYKTWRWAQLEGMIDLTEFWREIPCWPLKKVWINLSRSHSENDLVGKSFKKALTQVWELF